MCPARSYSGQHLVQSIVHRHLLIRVERVDGVHQNFERIAGKRFFALIRQSQANAPHGSSSIEMVNVDPADLAAAQERDRVLSSTEMN